MGEFESQIERAAFLSENYYANCTVVGKTTQITTVLSVSVRLMVRQGVLWVKNNFTHPADLGSSSVPAREGCAEVSYSRSQGVDLHVLR